MNHRSVNLNRGNTDPTLIDYLRAGSQRFFSIIFVDLFIVFYASG